MPRSEVNFVEFTPEQLKRFWSLVTIGRDDADGCWQWARGTGAKGNGVFNFGGNGHVFAHRASWMIHSGPIPEGFDVFRRCGDKLCVNPSHLRIGKRGSSELSREARLRALLDLQGSENECWLFTGRLDRCGYGKFDKTLAHRAAWEVFRGPIPVGMSILHRCDTPPCCNPEHLFVGTQADNVADMISKGRQSKVGAPKGHIGAGRKLSKEQVRLVKHAYSTGEVNMKQIALVLGVTQSVISRVITGKRYLTE